MSFLNLFYVTVKQMPTKLFILNVEVDDPSEHYYKDLLIISLAVAVTAVDKQNKNKKNFMLYTGPFYFSFNLTIHIRMNCCTNMSRVRIYIHLFFPTIKQSLKITACFFFFLFRFFIYFISFIIAATNNM